MFEWIHALPLWAAKAGALALFAGVLVFIWRLPAEFIFHEAPDRAWWRDLRIWATALLAFQCVIYYIF